MRIQEKRVCMQCVYYVEHFRKAQDKYFPVFCGHCICSGAKHRLPDAKACRHFQKRFSIEIVKLE